MMHIIRTHTLCPFLLAGGISGAGASEIALDGGDVLRGTIIERTPEQLVLQHAVLGRIALDLDKVIAVTDDGAEVVNLAAMQDGEPEEPPKDGAWRSSFELGFSASFGNSDNQSLHTGIRSKRETEADRTLFDALYFYGASNGDTTESRFTTGVLQEWLLPDSRWLLFGDLRYDYDGFQSWTQRLAGHGGAGYECIDKENFDLTGRIGAGVAKEWGSEDQELRPEGLIGFDLSWQITEKQSLTLGATLYPDLGDFGEYRTVSSLNWSVLVDEEAAMSLTAGLYHEYQSEVDPGFDQNDLRIYAGLKFDF